MSKRELILIIHDIRSAYNVGSMMRSADGLGVDLVYISGHSPYPPTPDDSRLPHIAEKIRKRLHKTALGAEVAIKWKYEDDIVSLIKNLKKQGFLITALEQAEGSESLPRFKADRNIALIVGSEIGGIDRGLMKYADVVLEIPMNGIKDSYNVSVAAAIALYELRYH